MVNKILRKLNILKQKNSNPEWKNKDSELYSLFFKKEMYILAYNNIKNDKNNDFYFSQQIIEKICDKMKTEQYTFSKKKTLIVKTSDKLKLLQFSLITDKVVQEMIRLILEAIWDSNKKCTLSKVFNKQKPGKKAHRVLQYINQKFKNIKWVIQGNIEKSYDNINHTILLNILEKRIQPGRFLRLIRKSINAGHLEHTSLVNNIIKTNQASIVFPILANIYLNQLDKDFLQQIKKIKEKHNKKKISYKAENPEYLVKSNFLEKFVKAYKKFLICYPANHCFIKNKKNNNKQEKTIENLKKTKLELFKKNVLSPNNLPINIKYLRYKNDWILGVDGNLEKTIKIKREIEQFLEKALNMQLNKSKITHVKSKQFFFLGYDIKAVFNAKLSLIKNTNSKKKNFFKKTTKYFFKFKAPIFKLIEKLYKQEFCNINGFPCSKKSWTTLQDHVIITNFNFVLKNLLGYYSKAHNQKSLKSIQLIIQYSCAMTLAHKHRISVPKIFKKFGTNLKILM